MNFILYHGDCLEQLKRLEDNSVDSVCCDPPYGLSFMGKKWDYDVPSVEVWAECLRVLKPGGHLLAFAGTRTQHRMAVRIEDAGFEIRDMIAWVYGSGFPKSMDVSKAIDKAAGADREVVGMKPKTGGGRAAPSHDGWQRPWMQEEGAADKPFQITAPATEAAKQWEGWGTALKPALEPITVARKPLIGAVAENVLEHGTGGLNINGCRVGTESTRRPTGSAPLNPKSGWNENSMGNILGGSDCGRWPANLIHDGSDEVVGLFPVTKSGFMKGGEKASKGAGIFGGGQSNADTYGDSGSAARFFYCAKASKRDRDEGCDDLEARGRNEVYGAGINTATKCDPSMGHTPESVEERPLRRNHHPTVKPTDLMRYLCRLVTPPGGVVLDPFMGSGSTGKAAVLEGFQFIGIEREAEYVEIAKARIEAAKPEPEEPPQPTLFD
jgi:site-specific DNA-methyltransferase (adenine-specific)